MKTRHRVFVNLEGRGHQYDVVVAHRILANCGAIIRDWLSHNTGKIALISNKKVFGLYGDEVVQSLRGAGFEVPVWLMGDGEEYKNFDSLKGLLFFLHDNNLSRTDSIVALGGGVVGDLAGFSASIYLRGIQFLQIPTTFLAMIDSSVGGKTAINIEHGKNLLGAFHQPGGVLIDVRTLKTLEQRELIAGFCEAVKQGAIGNKKLLSQTSGFLNRHSLARFSEYFADNEEFLLELKKLLKSHIQFKADVVMGDEVENPERSDSRSRKILNFGHTVAHALEKVTQYMFFKHGEAVGYGVLAAAEISKRLGLLDKNSLQLLNDAVASVGQLPETKAIDVQEVVDAFGFDKKIVNKDLQWILLESIGKPLVIKNSDIPRALIKDSLRRVLN